MRNRFVCLLLGLMGLVCMSAKSCTEVDTPWIVNSAIFANSENDFYVSGYVTGCDCDDAGFIKHFGPSGWSTIYSAPNGAFVWDLWGASSNELFAVSDEGILHFKDGAWTTLPVGDLPCGLGSIHGSAEDSVFAVGQNGAIAFFDGNLVSLTNGGTQAGLNGVFALSKEDVFAVGDQGTILHYDGSTWSRMASGTNRKLTAVWAASPTDVFAVGGSETERGYIILHYDGTGWSIADEGGPFHLLGVSGTASDNVYAVGASREGDEVKAAILHFGGTSWKSVSTNIGEFLWDVWTGGPGAYIVVGADNTLVRVSP